MTNDDIAAGEAALKAYVDQAVGWEASWVPEQAIRDGAIDVIRQWDSLGPMPNADAEATGRASCGMALYSAIQKAGYGGDVTTGQCMAGADAVINVVIAARPKTSPKGP